MGGYCAASGVQRTARDGRHADLASPAIPLPTSGPASAAAGMGSGSPAVGPAAVLPSALPGAAFVPYAGAVPDGGRRGFEAAVAVRAPIV